MRKGITISVSASNRQRLEAIVSDRNTSQKYAWRSRIILLTGAGVGTNGIMAATGKSKTTVWRWQERFAEAGVEGLLSDDTVEEVGCGRGGSAIFGVKDSRAYAGLGMGVGISFASLRRFWAAA